MEHKVLPLGLEPGDEQVHHQHAEHTDEGDALETQIEEARRQCEMDDPPPTFFKEGVIEDHQPEPEVRSWTSSALMGALVSTPPDLAKAMKPVMNSLRP